MAITLEQIAKLSGYSRGTVDRALHDRGRVRAEVAEQIKQIAREKGYKVNEAARALSLSNNPMLIGVISQTSETPFTKEVLKGIEAAGEEIRKFGARIKLKKIKGLNEHKLVQAIRDLRKDKCRGIALSGMTSHIAAKEIDEISAEGISVVTFNTDISDSRRICFIGENGILAGATAAGIMAQIIPERTDNGIAPIVQVISGYRDSPSHRDRVKGFLRELSSSRPDIVLPDILYCHDNNTEARDIVKTMLNSPLRGSLRGIYISASGVIGVCEAMRGIEHREGIKVISTDIIKENIVELKHGGIQFLIGDEASEEGYRAVMAVYNRIVNGIEPRRKIIHPQIAIKMKYNT